MANPPVEGDSNSATEPGVLGTNTATSVPSGAQAPGVNGTSTNGVGVSAETSSASQSAVFGINNAPGPIPSGLTYPAGGGVWGHTKVSGGTGVIGSTDPSISATGVLGIGNGTGAGVNGTSTNGVGVSGETASASQSAVFGINNAPGPIPSGLTYPAGGGVWGHTKVGGGTGVIGSTEPGVTATGVLGIGNGTGAGVNGTSTNGVGVSGETASPSQSAVFGINNAAGPVPSGLNHPAGGGVWGHTKVQNGSGVIGSVDPTLTQAAGVTGIGNPLAGQFFGNVTITGTLAVTVDIQIAGGDCAEQFDVLDPVDCAPGTVMAIGNSGTLIPSHREYDRCVAGVVAGAGDLRPGIVLDGQTGRERCRPIALIGKVCVKASADGGPIAVGDLLTSSGVVGHAMKATDPLRSFGAVLGKALEPLPSGTGVIRILIALQ